MRETPFGILLLRHRKPKTEEVVEKIMERCCDKHNPCKCQETCQSLYLQRAIDWGWRDPEYSGKANNQGSKMRSGTWLECNCYLTVRDTISLFG